MTTSSSANSNNNRPRKVCVVLIDRANYGRLKPVMRAIDDHPQLQLQTIVGGTMVLQRFGRPVQIVRRDGFNVDGEVFMELEGNTPITMAKSVGVGIVEFTNEYQRLRPDVVLIIGDRYEALAAAIAAAYANVCLVHVQGGEISGSIDESARHAITKFAHYHVPSTERAAENLRRMGERADTILTVGCPSSDLVLALDRRLDPQVINGQGSGGQIDVGQPFLLVLFHPTTTQFGDARQQIDELLAGLEEAAMPTALLWPNIDAGSDHISKAIRIFRDRHRPDWLRLLINLSPEDYLKVLARAACAVGNSSSFVRDAGLLGTPVVLVGDRQTGREWDRHVKHVAVERAAISGAIADQCAHGPYAPSTLYGDGQVAKRVAAALAKMELYVQKRLSYAEENIAAQSPAT